MPEKKTDYDCEPRPVQFEPLRWNPPSSPSLSRPPWEPDDPDEFARGWFSLDAERVFRCRAGVRLIGF